MQNELQFGLVSKFPSGLGYSRFTVLETEPKTIQGLPVTWLQLTDTLTHIYRIFPLDS